MPLRPHNTPLLDDRQVEALRALSLSRRALIGAGAGGILAAHLPGSALGQGAVIDITRARTDPLPVAIPDFTGVQPFGAQIAQVITANLARSGLFRPVDRRAFITQGAEATPRFADWRAVGAQALVTGSVAQQGERLRVEFRLWDVLPGVQIQGTAYTTPAANWRRIAHICSDAIYERLLGEKGYFDTRIVYVAESGPRDRRIKRLAIMDQDSENHRFLTDGSWLALTPRFHPSVNQVAFMSYIRNEPRVYLLDVDTGRQALLGNFPGMTFAPRFTPDGNSVLLSAIRGGDANIYSVDLRTRVERQLTYGASLDVSPSASPDGREIVFNSDRGGNQQLYVMAADGSNIRRISFGQGRYATPVWSPRGDLIAFTRMAGNTFAIGVMRPDGSGERILSEGFQMEGPSFAPNGRVLAFFRETPARDARGTGFSARLVSIDITGFNERVIPTPTDGSDPAWSPLLP
jgi:TolB protein